MVEAGRLWSGEAAMGTIVGCAGVQSPDALREMRRELRENYARYAGPRS